MTPNVDSLLCFFWTYLDRALAPSFGLGQGQVAEQGARLRDWRNIPALGLGKRDIFIYAHHIQVYQNVHVFHS